MNVGLKASILEQPVRASSLEAAEVMRILLKDCDGIVSSRLVLVFKASQYHRATPSS